MSEAVFATLDTLYGGVLCPKTMQPLPVPAASATATAAAAASTATAARVGGSGKPNAKTAGLSKTAADSAGASSKPLTPWEAKLASNAVAAYTHTLHSRREAGWARAADAADAAAAKSLTTAAIAAAAGVTVGELGLGRRSARVTEDRLKWAVEEEKRRDGERVRSKVLQHWGKELLRAAVESARVLELPEVVMYE